MYNHVSGQRIVTVHDRDVAIPKPSHSKRLKSFLFWYNYRLLNKTNRIPQKCGPRPLPYQSSWLWYMYFLSTVLWYMCREENFVFKTNQKSELKSPFICKNLNAFWQV